VPRYHFDLYNGLGLICDEEGRELPDTDAVEKEALKGIRSIICDEVGKGLLDLTGKVVVRDADGADVMTIHFHESVTITGQWIAPA
jgi:hypothetical protein